MLVFYIYFIISNLTLNNLAPNNLVPNEVDSFATKGLNFIYIQNYDSSFYYFNKIVEQYPEHPSGYFFLSYLCDLYNSDFLTDIYQADFDMYSEKAIEFSEKLKLSNESEGCFFEGAMLFSKALNYANNGDYIRALNFATPAYNELKRSIELNNSIYDAELGIGAFLFLKGTIETSIFSNNSQQEHGLNHINICAEKGKYLKIAAKNLIALLYLETGQISESIDICLNLISTYPNNRIFHWALLKAYKKQENWNSVITSGTKLIELINSGELIPPGNLAFVYYEIANANLNLNNNELAIEFCEKIIALPTDDHTIDFKRKAQDILRKI